MIFPFSHGLSMWGFRCLKAGVLAEILEEERRGALAMAYPTYSYLFHLPSGYIWLFNIAMV